MTKRTRKRAYRLSARANSQAETRQRIVDAAIRLHEKHGFRYVGKYEAVGFKFDRWLDIVHLQRAV